MSGFMRNRRHIFMLSVFGLILAGGAAGFVRRVVSDLSDVEDLAHSAADLADRANRIASDALEKAEEAENKAEDVERTWRYR